MVNDSKLLNKKEVDFEDIFKAGTFSITYLILTVLMKVKMLSGYKFLWPRVYRQTKNIFPESLGYFNPVFYFDDFFVAFLLFIIFCYAFNKNNKKLNYMIYLMYLVVCTFSILSSIVFYKFGTPINLAIINQIDSLYTMRTSIDMEIMENYRLISAMSLLLVLSIICPILLVFCKKLFIKTHITIVNLNFTGYGIITLLLILTVLFIIKSHRFGMDILTETPLTTISKSMLGNLKNHVASKTQNIPDFNDQLQTTSSKKIDDILVDQNGKYNVILIVLETTNANYFSPKGQYSKYLPNLCKLSGEGLYLHEFFTPFPRSSKAFFAILTGYYPLTNYKSLIKVTPNIEIPTIFSILKSRGYRTFAGYSGDFRYDGMANFLKNRGVDKFVDISNNDDRYDQISWAVDDKLIYDELMHWVDSLEDSMPFFALLLAMNTHHPFWTPEEGLKVVEEHDQKKRYINAIHYQDFLVGKLIDYLKRTKKLKNTVLIITGDHGAVFNFLKQKDTRASPYILDHDAFKVPFYLYYPLMKKLNKSPDIIGSHVDILPTILDLLEIETEQKFQGRSIRDEKITDRISFIYSDYYHHIVGGLTKDYFLMKNMTMDATILSSSLSFSQNVCDHEVEACSKLLSKVEEFDKFQNIRLLNLSR